MSSPGREHNNAFGCNDLDQFSVDLRLFLDTLRPNTQRAYIFALCDFKEFMGKHLKDATKKDAVAYVHNLKNRYTAEDGHLSAASVKRYYHGLSSCYSYLAACDYFPNNIFEAAGRLLAVRHAEQVRPTKCIPWAEVMQIIQKPDGKTSKGIRDRALLALLFGRGLRRSEALGLTLSDIYLEDGEPWIHIRNTKGGVSRRHKLPLWCYEYVSDWILVRRGHEARESDQLFQFTDRTLARIFTSYVKAAPHSARATFATRLLSQGIDPLIVSRELGHRTPAQAYVYDKRYLSKEWGQKVSYE